MEVIYESPPNHMFISDLLPISLTQAMGQAIQTMVSSPAANDVPATAAATKTVRRRMRKRIPKPQNQ